MGGQGGTCKTYAKCGLPYASRIIGGVDSDIKARPWQAWIFIRPSAMANSGFTCGASIIGDRWLLTAAHCLEGSLDNGVYVDVYYGSTEIQDEVGGIRTQAAEAYMHPNYDQPKGSTYNDIALLKLKETIQFKEGVQPICMRTDAAWVETGTNCIVSGWGTTINQDKNSGAENLRELSVPMLSDCGALQTETYNIQYDTQFCAGYPEGGKDSCQGDSGGPLACPNADGAYYQEGVVSFGNECAKKDWPGVYARVSSYMDDGWIQSYIRGDCYTR